MRGPGAAAFALVLAACGRGEDPALARLWTTREFLRGQESGASFGGWRADELLTLEGAPLRFQPGRQSGGPGLTVFPAIADGAGAAFVITEIWRNHPEPWVQPLWLPRDENMAPVEGALNVYPMSVDSNFYSPFWRGEFLLTPGLTPQTFRGARDALTSKVERRIAGLFLCPHVPEGTKLADDGTGPRDPITLERLLGVPARALQAWVEGEQVSFLPLGVDRVRPEGQTLIAANAYFFVSEAEGNPLPVSAVLPSNSRGKSLVNRIDVIIPSGAAVFVPSNRPELRALLEQKGLTVPVPRAELDQFSAFALRVARKPACLTDVLLDFPGDCDWLDTPEKIEALATAQRVARPVQLAIGVVSP